MRSTIIILSAFLLISAIACKKSDSPPTPLETAVITIAQPLPDSEYKSGDSVSIKGTVTAATTLHGYYVTILNQDDTVFSAHKDTHATQLSVNEVWICNMADSAVLKLIVSSPVNHDGDEVKKELNIKVHP